jgi:NAD-dependent deacetylase
MGRHRNDQVPWLVECVRRASRIVAFTGAGVSTSCGIPDFRGPHGIYVTRRYPEDVFDIGAFVRDPRGFYAFARDFLALESRIQPSLTHRVLARLEELGRLIGVVTQNIDGLHQRAGSRLVLELHGGFASVTCLRCGRGFPTAAVAERIQAGEIPSCPECGGLIKPDVVFFGEEVHHLDRARDVIVSSDLLLVLGSSLTVYPAATLPVLARGEVVVVNQGPVRVPPGATFIEAATDELLEQVAEALNLFG